MTWTSVDELRAATRARKQREPDRGDYFGPEWTAYFGSIVEPELYGGRYFVESRQPPEFEVPRLWHVVRATGPQDEPSFDTLGPWGSDDGYASVTQAKALAKMLAAAEKVGRLVERHDRSERFVPCATCAAQGKKHPAWATFVFSAPEEDEPHDFCSEHLAAAVAPAMTVVRLRGPLRRVGGPLRAGPTYRSNLDADGVLVLEAKETPGDEWRVERRYPVPASKL